MTLVRAVAYLTLVLPEIALANSTINMRQGVTDISENVYQLHMTIFIICCVIALLVFSVMFWSIIHHRKSKGAKPAQFHESTKVEILWTAIPVVILIAMAIPATQTLIKMEDPSKSDLTIKVTGSQWKWHYQYLTYEEKPLDIGFYSIISTPQSQITNQQEKTDTYLLEVDKPLVIPTGKKVRFLFTSDDVIHAWWIPDFAVKKDAVPGFINEAWTNVNVEGIYRGQCAELCGKNHGFMPIVVDVRSPEQFDLWLVEQQVLIAQQAQQEAALKDVSFTMDELMTLGKDVYEANCSVCHQPSGQGLPGLFPSLKNSPITTGDVQQHIDIVVKGKPGTAMQAFAKQLSSKQLAAVITYERNAWGINSGDLVQPKDVQADDKGATSAAETQPTTVDETPAEPQDPLIDLDKTQLMKLGEQAYIEHCAMCHQASGLGLPGAFPALKDSPVINGPIAQHINLVLNGKEMTAMQAFKGKLSATTIAAIVTYERNAWGRSGEIIQASDVTQVSESDSQSKGTE
ncbi:cytochrome c oxidase subunit II [Psychromonas sp. Urea-02u-13]|uniref:cytochrome c oxidase subunit II n=1 Tax=Psychromonas sp. Urea-02u-13 TaxID=2058326 RepID=UPI000C32CFF3|nr:cytochrome c oxidase subunit II [Psychromonas sp. Urea-02u-13]PKG40020.1 cytochrome c oxidase subunit II [Psychromonas sp. Urea-02u-13]